MDRLPITVWQVCDDDHRALRLVDVVDHARRCREGEVLERLEAGYHLPDLLLVHRFDERIAERTRLFARVFLDPSARGRGEIVVAADAGPRVLRRAFETALSLAAARCLRASLAGRGRRTVVPFPGTAPDLDDFELHYQPQWAISGESIVGVEALLRWHGLAVPGLGPEALIADAEARAEITPLGDWIFARAAWHLSEWLPRWPSAARLALNLAPIQLDDPSLGARLEHTLERAGVEPACFELEITADALARMGRGPRARATDLAELGFGIALDQLGAGVIERGVLEALPARSWKLDRGLVARAAADHDAALLVESLTALAHELGVRTVAVGVENTFQQNAMARLGCDAMQGYLRAEALPPDELASLIAAHGERQRSRRHAQR
jgi:EAL domain-containing protein (putative c-di-GMP-specific phosphodiesterase class I)